MAVSKNAYSSPTAIPITLTSLANSATAGQASTAVDNSATLYQDALVSLTVKPQAGTPATGATIYVYVYGMSDGSGHYTDNASGTDGAFSAANPTGMTLARMIPVSVSNQTIYSQPFSVAALFGGVLPQKWGIYVNNQSGFTLDSSVGSASFLGVNTTTV